MNLNNYENEKFVSSIGVNKHRDMGNVQPFFHWHPHYEITIIQKGKYVIESNSKVISSDKPGIFVHRPYCLHRGNADRAVEYIRDVIFVSKRLFNMFPSDLVDRSIFADASLIFVRPNADELSEIRTYCDMLYESVGNKYHKVPDYDEKKGALLAALIFHDIMKILQSGRGEAYSTRHSYIQDALQFISENLSEPMTVDSLAEKFGVGHTKFADDFKSVTGSTYKKYLTDLRMNRARELLLAGSSVINASLETGFSGESQFIATYKRYFGETPGRFAKVKSKSEE